MSAPMLWIILPIAAALVLYLVRRWERALHIAGISLALTLAWMAWYLPIDQPVALRLWSSLPAMRIQPDMLIFGGRFSLDNAARPALVMIYLAIAFWFGGAYAARSDRLFIPLGFGIAALLVASLAVQPAYFSALLVEAVALMCVPILSPPGSGATRPTGISTSEASSVIGTTGGISGDSQRGVLRFLIYQTLGMSLLLLAGMAPTTNASPTGASWPPQMVLAGIGLALVLAIFPFHTWMPMLAENGNPYPISFVFFILPATVSFLVLRYINQFAALQISNSLYTILAYSGTLMALMGGLWAAFERHAGRILSFAAIAQTGSMLLALSLQALASGPVAFPGLFFAQLVPQAAGLAVWALALSHLSKNTGGLGFQRLRGAARLLPLTSIAVLLGNLSLAGLPLLASFPVSIALWSALAQQTRLMAMLALTGCAFLFFAALRTLTVLLGRPTREPAEGVPGETTETGDAPAESQRNQPERSLAIGLLVVGMAFLFFLGLFPQVYFPTLSNLATFFANAKP